MEVVSRVVVFNAVDSGQAAVKMHPLEVGVAGEKLCTGKI